jgi:glycosyltransferase involved in cell wall biosynthesis
MSERLTIGYLTSFYARAGDTYIRREVEQLRRMGHVVHTFSIRKADPSELVSETIRQEHARTEYIFEAGLRKLAWSGLRMAIAAPGRFLDAAKVVLRHVPKGTKRRWIRQIFYLLEAAYLAERLKAKGVRHLHNHIGESSAMVAMLAGMLQGIPYSLTIHGPNEFDRPTLFALDEKTHRAAFVVAISEFTRSQLYRWVDYRDWSKIQVVHIGVGPMYLEHGPQSIGSAPRLVNIGRITEQKGQAILIQAAARLRDQGHDFELVIVGDGPMRGQIEQLIDQFGLRTQVRMTGFLGDQGVMEELLAARALVLPSFAEGLPGVFFEALALGRPVISTYIAAHPELIEPGVNGWLVPAGAVEPLANAMAEALTADPDQLERMGRAGAARVAEQHNVITETQKLAALFSNSGVGVDRPISQRPQQVTASNSRETCGMERKTQPHPGQSH